MNFITSTPRFFKSLIVFAVPLIFRWALSVPCLWLELCFFSLKWVMSSSGIFENKIDLKMIKKKPSSSLKLNPVCFGLLIWGKFSLGCSSSRSPLWIDAVVNFQALPQVFGYSALFLQYRPVLFCFFFGLQNFFVIFFLK